MRDFDLNRILLICSLLPGYNHHNLELSFVGPGPLGSVFSIDVRFNLWKNSTRQVDKLRLGKVRQFPQGHTAGAELGSELKLE